MRFGVGERGELKHLSIHRKRNQIEIPRVTASESGREQTESLLERDVEMWC